MFKQSGLGNVADSCKLLCEGSSGYLFLGQSDQVSNTKCLRDDRQLSRGGPYSPIGRAPLEQTAWQLVMYEDRKYLRRIVNLALREVT